MKQRESIKRICNRLTIGVLAGIILLGTNFTARAQETEAQKAERMAWFQDAKLGIFVHYGIYAVNGIDESWSFFNGYTSHKTYMEQLQGFTAAKYNAEEWAKLFKEAGAKYAVLTSKHHDGVALWKGNFNHWNTIDHTPAPKDLVEPFMKAMRAQNMKAGLYYSLIDWSYPDYPAFLRDSVRYKNDPQRWGKFTDFYFTQMTELSNRYNPDLYWFDGDWEHTAEEWKAKELRAMMTGVNPNIIVNSRLGHYGDYATPEQGVPVVRPVNPYWELCLTMNDSWGYQPSDNNYKTPYQLIRTFVDCISNGGNLLLDVGPKADGTIPEEQIAILKAFGRWTAKHSEAIYGTRAGLLPGHTNQPTAFSKDGKTLYLYLDHQPKHAITIAGVEGKIKNVKIIGEKTKLKYSRDNQDQIIIEQPTTGYDPIVTVIAIEFKDAIKTNSQRLDGNAMLTNLMEDAQWKEKHAKDLEKSLPGIETPHYAGYSRLSADKSILYLMVDGKPNGPLMIKGLKNKINRIWVVNRATRLQHQIIGKLYWSHVPGIAYINLPDYALDNQMTVIAVLLDGPIDLYKEEGQVISSN